MSEYKTPKLVEEFLVRYLKNNKGKSDNTIKNYRCDLNILFKYLMKKKKWDTIGEKEIKSITLDDLSIFMEYLVNKKNSPATRCRRVASIKAFFDYLAAKEILLKNPTMNLEAPKIPKRLPAYLSLEEAMTLINSVSQDRYTERNKAILTIFLNCGLRLSELINIKLPHIKGNILLIPNGKGDKSREVYLNESTQKAIGEYMVVRPTTREKTLFISERGNPISDDAVQSLVKNAIRKAGLDDKKYSTHKLRHTAATLMFQGGTDIRTLQELLGHENLSTTEIYTKVSNQQIADAINNNPLNRAM